MTGYLCAWCLTRPIDCMSQWIIICSNSLCIFHGQMKKKQSRLLTVLIYHRLTDTDRVACCSWWFNRWSPSHRIDGFSVISKPSITRTFRTCLMYPIIITNIYHYVPKWTFLSEQFLVIPLRSLCVSLPLPAVAFSTFFVYVYNGTVNFGFGYQLHVISVTSIPKI